MKTVKFNYKSGIYNPDDIASFEDHVAKRIVEMNYGEYVELSKEQVISNKKQMKPKANRRKGYVTK